MHFALFYSVLFFCFENNIDKFSIPVIFINSENRYYTLISQ
jgi:hypothetical protein